MSCASRGLTEAAFACIEWSVNRSVIHIAVRSDLVPEAHDFLNEVNRTFIWETYLLDSKKSSAWRPRYRAIALKRQEVRAKPAKDATDSETGLIQSVDQPIHISVFRKMIFLHPIILATLAILARAIL